MNKAMISSGWELHVVNGHLFITSEEDADVQVHLDAQAAYDLLEYLYQHRDELYHARRRETPEKPPKIEAGR